MYEGSFTIQVSRHKKQEVVGVLYPEFGLAYDERYEGEKSLGWCVTHLATGMLLFQPYETEAQAKAALEAAGPLYDWPSLQQGEQRVRTLPPDLAVVFEQMKTIDARVRWGEAECSNC